MIIPKATSHETDLMKKALIEIINRVHGHFGPDVIIEINMDGNVDITRHGDDQARYNTIDMFAKKLSDSKNT